ncbi:hypothetical protein MKX03_014929 [Papaver bracteatum]|nr:hypothetical protein MKX03_014929 [Papaver bracteatum]
MMKGEYGHHTCISGGLLKILCMQGEDDDGSYARNSEAPASAISLSKPILLKGIESMKLFDGDVNECLRIADLEGNYEPEFEAFFSDLPSNDFNSLFKSFQQFNDTSKKRRYYSAGVPGSFYHRLFPKRKLHGLIDEETRDTFSIPTYMRSTDEVFTAFRRCGGFEIQRLEYQRIVEHSKEKQEEWIRIPIRATLKPIVESHIGPKLSEELFKRIEKRASEDTAMLHKTCFYGVIIVCAIRIKNDNIKLISESSD